eukprot:278239_1
MSTTDTLTNKSFVINMINWCIGVGLLAKPYAFSVSGWYSIISVLMAFSFITYSGYLFALVTLESYGINEHQYINIPGTDEESQYTDEDEKNESVYHIVGKKALGKYGGIYVNYSQILSLTVGCITALIIEWELMLRIIEYIFTKSTATIPTYLDEHFIFIYILLFAFPIIFILNWNQITFVSKISVISIILIGCTMLYIFLLCLIEFPGNTVPSYYFEKQSYSQYETENMAQYAINNMPIQQRIFYTFIIFKAGITGNPAIPPMVIAMKDKSVSNIRFVIFISYLIVTILCSLFGLIGVVIYNKYCDVLILNN